MPVDLDYTKPRTPHWSWEADALDELGKLRPADPYKPVRKLTICFGNFLFSSTFSANGTKSARSQQEWMAAGVKYATKEEVIEKLMASDYYVKSAPNDVADALGPNTYKLPSYLKSTPIHIYSALAFVLNFRPFNI